MRTTICIFSYNKKNKTKRMRKYTEKVETTVFLQDIRYMYMPVNA